MSTNFEKRPEYTVGGRVVDRTTRAGIRGVRVEAWDRDTRYHDLLGQAVTNADGQFAIGFDSAYFGDYAPDRAPDLFFKLFLDGRVGKAFPLVHLAQIVDARGDRCGGGLEPLEQRRLLFLVDRRRRIALGLRPCRATGEEDQEHQEAHVGQCDTTRRAVHLDA